MERGERIKDRSHIEWKILTRLVNDEPPKKKTTDEEFIDHVNEEIKGKSHSTPDEFESEETS